MHFEREFVRFLSASLMFVVALFSSAASLAQSENTAEIERARILFERGLAEYDASRYDAAVLAFRESLSASERSSTRFNLARALVRIRQFRDARSNLEQFLAVETDAARRSAARELLEQADAQLARVMIRVDVDASELRIDDARVALPMREPVLLDPGPHVISVRADGYEEQMRRVDVVAGSRVELEMSLDARAARLPGSATPEEALADAASADQTPLVQKPWFWVAVVGSAAVVAGGITAAVLLTRSSEPSSSTGWTVNTLTFR